MHEYLDAENYIYKYIYIYRQAGDPMGQIREKLGRSSWEYGDLNLPNLLEKFITPPTHPVFQTSHCLLEPVCLNRTSRNPIVYWNPIASGWIQVTSLTFTRLHHPRSAWWYVRSASRPLKTPAGRPVGV